MAKDLERPSVSVVIPHYNRPQRLIETLRSVAAQTRPDWEVIIVDDASPSDPTPALSEALADPRVRLVRLEANGGPGAARNVGIELARGRFVAFLDSDDAWLPQKLEQQLAAIAAAPDPERVICSTRMTSLGEGGQAQVRPARGVRPDEAFGDYLFLGGGSCQTSTIMLPTAAARAVRFAPELRQFEDYLFFIRAGALQLSHVFVETPLVVWANDERPDRLSRGDQKNMRNVEAFLRDGEAMLSPRAQLAFLSKYAGVVLLRARPAAGLRTLLAAVGAGAITPRHALSVAGNGLLPGPALRMLHARKPRRTAPQAKSEGRLSDGGPVRAPQG